MRAAHDALALTDIGSRLELARKAPRIEVIAIPCDKRDGGPAAYQRQQQQSEEAKPARAEAFGRRGLWHQATERQKTKDGGCDADQQRRSAGHNRVDPEVANQQAEKSIVTEPAKDDRDRNDGQPLQRSDWLAN